MIKLSTEIENAAVSCSISVWSSLLGELLKQTSNSESLSSDEVSATNKYLKMLDSRFLVLQISAQEGPDAPQK